MGRLERRAFIEQRDRKLRDIQRKRDKYWEERRKTCWIYLDEPYQYGFVRTYVLTAKMAARKDAAIFENILRMVNSRAFCKNAEFVRIKGKRKRRRKVAIGQEPKLLSEREFRQLNPIEQAFFRKLWYPACWGRGIYRFQYRFPEHFEFKVEPNIIYRIRKTVYDMDSEIEELNNWIEARHLEFRLNKLLGWWRDFWYDFSNERVDRSYFKEKHLTNSLIDRFQIPKRIKGLRLQ